MLPGEALLNRPLAWGRKLIEAQDHDPLYVGLAEWWETKVDADRIRRYMLAYWCCYDVGASYFISASKGAEYWDWLETAARNEDGEGPQDLAGIPEARWPRAHERRHWRGDKCVQSVKWLRSMFPEPETAVFSLEELRTHRAVEDRMGMWPQFGPWIAFKAADMLERIFAQPITFNPSVLIMYKDPAKAAHQASELLGVSVDEIVQGMLNVYGQMPAPGFPGRMCNIQEVETVLCKWKSAHNGHYWIGLDTRDHRKKLETWGAQDLLACYPKEIS